MRFKYELYMYDHLIIIFRDTLQKNDRPSIQYNNHNIERK